MSVEKVSKVNCRKDKAMSEERQQVVDKLRVNVDFDGLSLDMLIEEAAEFKRLVTSQGGDADSAFISHEQYLDEYVVKFTRPETDKEYDKRQAVKAKERAKEEDRKAKAKEMRLREYERLKKEFGELKGQDDE